MCSCSYYLTQNHSCEDGLQVSQIMLAELSNNACIQQHQPERARIWSDADHHCVPQVCEGGFTVGLG